MDNIADMVISEEEILNLYKLLQIDINIPLDIDRLGKEYQEAVADICKEDYCTYAFVGEQKEP